MRASSLKLVTLDDNVPFKDKPDEFAVHEPDPRTLIAFLKAMEFSTITRRVAAHFGIEDVDAICRPVRRDGGQCAWSAGSRLTPRGGRHRRRRLTAIARDARADRPRRLRHRDDAAASSIDWIARAREKGTVCVDTETTSLDPMQAGLCGVSLAVAPGEACYIPCGHRKGDGLDLDGAGQDRHSADGRGRCSGAAEAAAGRRQRPEDRAEPEI